MSPRTTPQSVTGTAEAGHFGTDLPDPGEVSIGQLMGEIAADLSNLVRKEVELAKAEVRTEAAKAGKAAGMLGGAGYATHMTLLTATLALVFGLAHWMSLGWAAFVVTLLWAAAAAVLAVQGRTQLRRVHPKPERTAETLKEDLQWARHPRS